MRKVQNVTKLLFLFYLILICSNGYGQLKGNYCIDYALHYNYDCIRFYDNNLFEYHTGADLGDFYFGRGEYKIIGNNLILNYNKTSPLELGYYLTKIWTNSKDSINVNMTTMTLDKKPVPYLSITFSDSLAKNGVNGIATDRDGRGSIIFKKDRKNINLFLTGVGYKSQNITISKYYNYRLNVYILEDKGQGIPIKGQIDTLKIVDLKKDYFKVEEKNGKITVWKKFDK